MWNEVDWVGTSMGGLIGMMLAAQSGNPIRRLVVNDIGAFVSKEGLARIRAYVGLDPTFELGGGVRGSRAEQRRSIRRPQDRRAMAQARPRLVLRKKPDGGYGFNYDPRIGDAFKAGPIQDVDLWPVWDALRCPTFLLRGEGIGTSCRARLQRP